jgi:thioredoxin-related protein
MTEAYLSSFNLFFFSKSTPPPFLNFSLSSLKNSYHYVFRYIKLNNRSIIFHLYKTHLFLFRSGGHREQMEVVGRIGRHSNVISKDEKFLFIINIEEQMYYCLTLKKKVSFVEVKNSWCL